MITDMFSPSFSILLAFSMEVHALGVILVLYMGTISVTFPLFVATKTRDFTSSGSSQFEYKISQNDASLNASFVWDSHKIDLE